MLEVFEVTPKIRVSTEGLLWEGLGSCRGFGELWAPSVGVWGPYGEIPGDISGLGSHHGGLRPYMSF